MSVAQQHKEVEEILSLLEAGRPEACLDAVRALRAEHPMELGVRVLEGRVLVRLHRWDEAEPVLRAAVQDSPDTFQARVDLGKVLLARGEFQQALDHLRAAQRLEPLDERPYRAMVHVFRVTGQVRPGADFLGKLIDARLVASPGLMLELAELELLADRPERVPSMLANVQEHPAVGPLQLIELARLWCELTDLETVQRLAVRAEAMEHPEAPGVATVLRALEAELQGDGDRARGLHGRACNQLPGHFFPHVRTALLFLFQPNERNNKAAAAHLRQAVKLAPRAPEVRLVHAILLAAQGDPRCQPALELVAGHAGMRPSLRRLARSTLEMLGQLLATP